MSETAKLKIWRGLDRKVGHWDTYEVPFEPGQSVLDGVRWVRQHADPVGSSLLRSNPDAKGVKLHAGRDVCNSVPFTER